MQKLLAQYRGFRKELYILFIGRLVTAMGSFVWPMMTFLLTTKIGLSDGTTTVLIATSTILCLPAAIWGGKLADRYPRKNIIILFDSLTVSLYVLASLLPIRFVTAIIVFLAGLFQTIESPAYDALNADYSSTEDRERAFSFSYLGFNMGFIVGASLSGILFAKHTNLSFLINGLAILTSTVLIWRFVDPKNAVHDASGSDPDAFSEYELPVDDSLSVLTVLKQRSVVGLMMLVGCLASLPNTIMGILLPLQLKELMGATGASVFGYLNSVNGAVVIIFTPILTVLMKRITEIPKCALGLFFFVCGLVLFRMGLPLWILYAGMFIFTLGEVVTVLGSNPYNTRRTPASHWGRIGGVSMVVYSIFSSLTQYAISFILVASDSNYPLVWLVFILASSAAVFLYLLLYRPDRKMFPLLYRGDIRF